MRRSLVMTDDTARHPFRASLPPHVKSGRAPILPRHGGCRPGDRGAGRWTMTDLREFLMAYCACFLAVSAFIA